jgi:outer membrane protein OmpA-like peptidoglycan-associated protein
VGVLALVAQPSEAQFGRRLKDAMQSNAENRAIQKVVDAQNKAIDAALTGAKSSPADEAAGNGLYGALHDNGRTTLDGLAFEEGTATMRQESVAPLKAVGSMLRAHGDLKVRIETYASDKNVAVARSQAVRDAIAKGYAIDPARMDTEGYAAPANPRTELVQR